MFKNLVTLVTGGASGLGRATVNRFVEKGSKVVICDRPASQGAQIAKDMGDNVNFIPTDITSESDVENLMNEIAKSHGKLDVLVNCAGIMRSFKLYHFGTNKAMHMEDIKHTLLTNIVGPMNVIRIAAGLIGKNDPDENGQRGLIVNTSGSEAFRGTTGQTLMSATSGAIHSMTKPLAADLCDQGIRVVTIAPGMFMTPNLNFIPIEIRDAISTECMISPKRFGEPDEFAHMVETVVCNPYINATTIEVSAGLKIDI